MKFLIDTHVCLWAVSEPNKLSTRVKEILEDSASEIIYNQVSLYEIAIKFQVGKLPNFNTTLQVVNNELLKKGFILQAISSNHLLAYFNCTFFNEDHRDPFDRLLIAIADNEQIGLITKDDKFELYKDKIQIIW